MTTTGKETFLQRKFWNPLLGQLKRGTTPEKLSSSVAWGTVLAIFPILGLTSGLCFIAGHIGKMNHIALQTVNYLLTPAQLLAIPVFIHFGEKIFGLPPITFDPRTLVPEFFAAPLLFLSHYGLSALAGIFVWGLIAYPLVRLLETLFLPILKRRSSS